MQAAVRTLALTVALTGATAASAAESRPAAPRILANYCSPSGDVCFGIFSRSGGVYLELTTFAHYFKRYSLCVKPPGAGAASAPRCRSYPVFPRRNVWASSLKYSRHFPVVGTGAYHVTWKLQGKRLGPTLHFRLPQT